MRLIDADEIMPSLRLLWICGGVSFGEGVKSAEEIINNAPTIEAEPVKHGRWIIRDNPGTGWYRVTCSECGEDVTSVVPVIGFFPDAKAVWNYCPDCGAKMDAEEGEEA